jgi:GTP-binding protein Era
MRIEIIGISAQTRYNLPILIEHLLQHLPKGPKYYHEEMTTDRNERFFTTEIIRETILSMYKVTTQPPSSAGSLLINSFLQLG